MKTYKKPPPGAGKKGASDDGLDAELEALEDDDDLDDDDDEDDDPEIRVSTLCRIGEQRPSSFPDHSGCHRSSTLTPAMNFTLPHQPGDDPQCQTAAAAAPGRCGEEGGAFCIAAGSSRRTAPAKRGCIRCPPRRESASKVCPCSPNAHHKQRPGQGSSLSRGRRWLIREEHMVLAT